MAAEGSGMPATPSIDTPANVNGRNGPLGRSMKGTLASPNSTFKDEFPVPTTSKSIRAIKVPTPGTTAPIEGSTRSGKVLKPGLSPVLKIATGKMLALPASTTVTGAGLSNLGPIAVVGLNTSPPVIAITLGSLLVNARLKELTLSDESAKRNADDEPVNGAGVEATNVVSSKEKKNS